MEDKLMYIPNRDKIKQNSLREVYWFKGLDIASLGPRNHLSQLMRERG